MDLCNNTMELLLKCEPEVVVKSEPIFTEHNYDVTVNNLVKTECESVSYSSSNYGCQNEDIIKQECKCSFCMRKQLATLLPTTNILPSVQPGFKGEPFSAASEHSQQNAGNSMSTENSASYNQTRKPKIRTKTRHSCPYCNKNFTRRDSFNIHLRRKHSKNNPDLLMEPFNDMYFTCDICNFKSSCSRSFKSHMLMHETFVDNNIFKCKNCDYESSSKWSIQVHIKRKHPNNKVTYSCRFCNKSFIKNVSFVDHLLCHHGDKFDKSLKKLISLTIKYCNLCDFRVHSKGKLIQHMQRDHSNDRLTYSCKFCNKTLCSKRTLVDHLLSYHDNKFDKSLKKLLSLTIKHCYLCDFRVHSKCMLIGHIKRKHSNDSPACRFCNKTFFSKRSLVDHLLCHHGDKFEKSLKKLLSLDIKHCDLCEFRVHSKGVLIEHIQRKHFNDSPAYTCMFCDETLSTKEYLADHLLMYHGDRFDKSLKTLLAQTIKNCKLCDFRVVRKAKLDQHMAKHDPSLVKADTDAIIFKCNNCDYETIQKCLLHSHNRRRHSNKSRHTYSCRLCNKTFFTKTSLADHLLVKHSEKFDKSLKTLFSLTIRQCNLCDFRVINHSTFNLHIQGHHPNERPTYTCRFCNKTLLNKTSLADHLLCKHGEKFDESLKTILSQTINHCKLCDFRAVGKGKLDQHMTKRDHNLVEADTDAIIFKCNNCVYQTFRKFNLQSHIEKKHSNNRHQYSCKLCNKTFFNKAPLADHLLGKHGEKFDKSLKTLFSLPIKHCKLCDLRVINKNILNHHIQRHHPNDTPTYSCRFCNKIFFSKVSLADHLLCNHAEKFDKSLKTILSQTIKHCKLCDFRVVSKRILNHHIQKRHSSDT